MPRHSFNVISRLQETTLKMSNPGDERSSCKGGPVGFRRYCRSPNRGLLLVMGATRSDVRLMLYDTVLLRTFAAICDAGSFTKAAREVNLTQFGGESSRQTP